MFSRFSSIVSSSFGLLRNPVASSSFAPIFSTASISTSVCDLRNNFLQVSIVLNVWKHVDFSLFMTVMDLQRDVPEVRTKRPSLVTTTTEALFWKVCFVYCIILYINSVFSCDQTSEEAQFWQQKVCYRAFVDRSWSMCIYSWSWTQSTGTFTGLFIFLKVLNWFL